MYVPRSEEHTSELQSRFAVCRVLLQFQVPRHPPYALIRLITAYFLVSLESVCLTFTLREYLSLQLAS